MSQSRIPLVSKRTLLGAVLVCAFPLVAFAHSPDKAHSSTQTGLGKAGHPAGVADQSKMGHMGQGGMAKHHRKVAEHRGMAAGNSGKGGQTPTASRRRIPGK